MNGETLFLMLLGHCLADFAFQPSWMAFNKKKASNFGFNMCVTHCGVYTSIVLGLMCFSQEARDIILSGNIATFISLYITIFLSHFIIDRSNFIDWWVRKLEIRSWDTHIDRTKDNLNTTESICLSFGSIVYVMIDNSFHLLLMFLTFKLFYSII